MPGGTGYHLVFNGTRHTPGPVERAPDLQPARTRRWSCPSAPAHAPPRRREPALGRRAAHRGHLRHAWPPLRDRHRRDLPPSDRAGTVRTRGGHDAAGSPPKARRPTLGPGRGDASPASTSNSADFVAERSTYSLSAETGTLWSRPTWTDVTSPPLEERLHQAAADARIGSRLGHRHKRPLIRLHRDIDDAPLPRRPSSSKPRRNCKGLSVNVVGHGRTPRSGAAIFWSPDRQTHHIARPSAPSDTLNTLNLTNPITSVAASAGSARW